ncbi:MAG TPA: N-acetylmuramoyl-L-alanine amidase, partial [bacterium]|nr:N-acetylmuramoyl-L-alanine amidase [bacterium]
MKRFLAFISFFIVITLSAGDSIKDEDRASLTDLLTELTKAKPDKILNDIKVWPGESSIRVAIYPSDKVKYKYNLLKGEDKDRIYIDLLAVDADGFTLPDVKYDSFLKGIRMGKRDTGIRIVLDTGKVESYNVIEMEEPWRIVIDYYGKKPVEVEKKSEVKESKVSEKVKENEQKKEPQAKKKKVVVIDPGHGGKDPGAVVGKLYEKDIVFNLAKRIKKLSQKYDSIEIKLTRDKDIFLPLEERAAIANTMNGDLFISLHANSFSDENVVLGGGRQKTMADFQTVTPRFNVEGVSVRTDCASRFQPNVVGLDIDELIAVVIENRAVGDQIHISCARVDRRDVHIAIQFGQYDIAGRARGQAGLVSYNVDEVE